MSEGGIPSELPKGWAWATLDDVAESVRNGIFVSRPGTEPNGVPILRIGAVRPLRLDLSDLRYSGQSAEELGAADRLVLPGDLLFTRYNGNPELVGACASVPDTAPLLTYPDKLIRVRVDRSVVLPEFVAYAFSWEGIRARVREHVKTTAGQAGIAGGELKNIAIPLPPLEEQRRIVAALEEQLSRLSSGTSYLSTSMAKADALRRKVLANLTRAPSDGWTEYQLGYLATGVRNGMYVSRPGTEPDGVAILRIGAVRPLRLDLTDLRYSAVEEQRVAKDGYLLAQGDLLFTRYNGNPDYVGACAVVPGDTGPLTYPDKLIRVQLRRDVADPDFVAMACTGGTARQVIAAAVKTTAGQAGIAGKDLKKVPISLPSLDEQRKRVRVYRQWETVIARLEAEAAKGARRAEQLRRSLLAEAFTGRLVPQEPTDEHAGALLDRIRAERQAAGVTKSRRRIPRRTPAQRKSVPDVPPPPRADTPALATATQPTLDLEMPS
ncbi:restriction endonuclease subunit S [Streptomyces sp. NPDC052020]|uniref:restriction endonuclease subunit S n=1 Tax=Streptomyces sp. NPDC052020 TaxID=3155677 RepID=UPI003415FE1D